MQRIVSIMGPTCSGKTDLAIEIGKHMPAHLISVDSALIYKDMNIGTAKPDQDRDPHALVDIIAPHEQYSVARFLNDVSREIEAAWAEKKLPILVGGTMMYFNALRQGIAEIPESDPEVRARLAALQQAEGTPHLHRRLEACDPDLFARLNPNDTQRVMRALEVFETSGVPLSQWQAKPPKPILDPALFTNVLLIPVDRQVLHQNIERRFDLMIEAGFLDEMKSLLETYPVTEDSPSMRSVGYRQALAYLKGETDFDTMRAQSIAATRQLAKRQLTWLRSWPSGICFDSASDYQSTLLDLIQKNTL